MRYKYMIFMMITWSFDGHEQEMVEMTNGQKVQSARDKIEV